MSLSHMEYFLKVCETGSMTAASESAHVSVQAISKAIKQLEREYDCTFLIRGTNGVEITEEGNQFRETCEVVFRELETFRDGIATRKEIDSCHDACRIKVVVANTLSALMSETLLSVRSEWPHMTSSLYTVDPLLLAPPDRDSDYDIAIFGIPADYDFSDEYLEEYEVDLLHRGNLRLFVKKGSDIASRRTISNTLLSTIPLAAYSTEDHKSNTIQMLSNFGINAKINSSADVGPSLPFSGIPEDYAFLQTKFLCEYSNEVKENMVSVPLRTPIPISYYICAKRSSLVCQPMNRVVEVLYKYFRLSK